MTAQIPDRLMFKQESYQLYSEPLRPWLTMRRNKGILFRVKQTGCWRGYVAEWEVIEDRLFLSSIRGQLLLNINGQFIDGPQCCVADLFPGQAQPVFADWVTQTLRCPFGNRLKYVHMPYASIYEYELRLVFEKGVLIEYQTIENEMPPPYVHREDDYNSSGIHDIV